MQSNPVRESALATIVTALPARRPVSVKLMIPSGGAPGCTQPAAVMRASAVAAGAVDVGAGAAAAVHPKLKAIAAAAATALKMRALRPPAGD